MADIIIKIQNGEGQVMAQAESSNQVICVYDAEYAEGDKIIFNTSEAGKHYVIRIDDAMDESLVYLTGTTVEYTIPFHEKKISYNPKAFTGNNHYITMREAKAYEVKGYRNLAKNVMDQHGDTGCFPHAWANVETRGESVFAARNAIDGIVANELHGAWPFESWGINQQADAAITLEFGRPVDIDMIALYTRADFPHDNWWVSGMLTFSDGSQETIHMEKSVKPHEFAITKKQITWVKLDQLIKAEDPSPFPALTQIEVYGV